MRIIIDGYNLIFQCGLHEQKLSAPQALERARKRLIRELAQRIEQSQRSGVTVVFDAKTYVPTDQNDFRIDGFKVRYARNFPDADAMIGDLVAHHSHPGRLTVVSSDHQVQTTATRRGAKAIDSDVWFDSLPRQQPRVREPVGSDPILSAEEQRELAEIFGAGELAEPANESETDTSAEDDAEESFNPFPPGYGEDLLDER